MKLPQYSSIDEKMNFFEKDSVVLKGVPYVIKTRDEFEAMMHYVTDLETQINRHREDVKQRFRTSKYFKNDSEEQHTKRFVSLGLENGLLYRGVSQAKYKIFSSAQRSWMEKDCKLKGIAYVNFVDTLIRQIRSNKLLHDYYTALRVPENDLLYMSLLQHYGQCSPLIDVSYDIFVSLFFALHDNNLVAAENDIDDYCSLYVFNTYANQYWTNLDVILQDGQEKADEMLQDAHYPIESIDTSNTDIADRYASWKNPHNANRGLHDFELAFVKLPTAKGAIAPTTRTGEPICWTNLNLLAQKGGFFLYTKDEMPLEEYIYYEKMLPNIICFNIHKGLKDEIMSTISLSESDLFPKMENIVKHEIETFKATL